MVFQPYDTWERQRKAWLFLGGSESITTGVDDQKQIYKSHNSRSVFTNVFLPPLWIWKGRDKEKFYPPFLTLHYRQRAGRLLVLLFDSSVMSDSVWLFMACSMPGFPVLHQLPEFAQTRVQWVGDAIQPSHRLSSPPPIFLSIRVFTKESALMHQVAKVLELRLQHQSFQWIFRVDFL